MQVTASGAIVPLNAHVAAAAVVPSYALLAALTAAVTGAGAIVAVVVAVELTSV